MVGSPLDKIHSFTSVNDCAPIEDNSYAKWPNKKVGIQVLKFGQAGKPERGGANDVQDA